MQHVSAFAYKAVTFCENAVAFCANAQQQEERRVSEARPFLGVSHAQEVFVTCYILRADLPYGAKHSELAFKYVNSRTNQSLVLFARWSRFDQLGSSWTVTDDNLAPLGRPEILPLFSDLVQGVWPVHFLNLNKYHLNFQDEIEIIVIGYIIFCS